MKTFEVKEDFYLDGKKVKIISGGMHYFRTVPEYWRDRLEKLKALGCNTVETYIPWIFTKKRKESLIFRNSGYYQICKTGPGAWFDGDSPAISLYLCRMGVWRIAILAAEGRRHAPSLFLSAISTTCERIL